MSKSPSPRRFAVCLSNDGYLASLEVRKLYVLLDDDEAEKHDMFRVIDESGEDYLYPKSRFAEIALPSEVEEVLVRNSPGDR
jgi:hypothetical protein